jgi:hypothetical protein
LTAYACRHLFESTEVAGNETFTEIFQINFSWFWGEKVLYEYRRASVRQIKATHNIYGCAKLSKELKMFQLGVRP